MSNAVKCPVCEGKGVIPKDCGCKENGTDWTKPCHGCLGKGWVEIVCEPSPTVCYDPSTIAGNKTNYE